MVEILALVDCQRLFARWRTHGVELAWSESLESTRNIAVILAGGVGTRIGLDTPKQLIKIAGRPIMEHTLAIFDEHPLIDEVIVLMARGHLDKVHEIVRKNQFQKVSTVLEGSGTRNDPGRTQRDCRKARRRLQRHSSRRRQASDGTFDSQ